MGHLDQTAHSVPRLLLAHLTVGLAILRVGFYLFETFDLEIGIEIKFEFEILSANDQNQRFGGSAHRQDSQTGSRISGELFQELWQNNVLGDGSILTKGLKFACQAKQNLFLVTFADAGSKPIQLL